ncbi:hypothetical protein GAMM_100035 [Gammaproteobacteria bacterium]
MKQDHRHIERIIKPIVKTAIAGVELHHVLRKEQTANAAALAA